PLRLVILFVTDHPPTELSTLSLHDALPISPPISSMSSPGFSTRPSTRTATSKSSVASGRSRLRHRCPDRVSRPRRRQPHRGRRRSEEHTSELQSLRHLVCRLLLEKKKEQITPGPRAPGPALRRFAYMERSSGKAPGRRIAIRSLHHPRNTRHDPYTNEDTTRLAAP